jgi:hypothetical protein
VEPNADDYFYRHEDGDYKSIIIDGLLEQSVRCSRVNLEMRYLERFDGDFTIERETE